MKVNPGNRHTVVFLMSYQDFFGISFFSLFSDFINLPVQCTKQLWSCSSFCSQPISLFPLHQGSLLCLHTCGDLCGPSLIFIELRLHMHTYEDCKALDSSVQKKSPNWSSTSNIPMMSWFEDDQIEQHETCHRWQMCPLRYVSRETIYN